MENKAGELKVTLHLDADQFKSQLNEIEAQLDRILEKAERVMKVFGKEAAAATTAKEITFVQPPIHVNEESLETIQRSLRTFATGKTNDLVCE
ncbi:hypothetical protein [Effusibacillus consociatus]|uniref:Uncharacterized protein n=1 Tax=Effusibacillus consociatus TaxID=1117041 RepID=A0ABV9Q3D5_9BACL